jgi:hypothetical protein
MKTRRQTVACALPENIASGSPGQSADNLRILSSISTLRKNGLPVGHLQDCNAEAVRSTG